MSTSCYIISYRGGDNVQSQDTYKEVKVFNYPNATVKVYIPDLAEDEKNRRMNEIHKAAQQILMSIANQ